MRGVPDGVVGSDGAKVREVVFSVIPAGGVTGCGFPRPTVHRIDAEVPERRRARAPVPELPVMTLAVVKRLRAVVRRDQANPGRDPLGRKVDLVPAADGDADEDHWRA